MGDKYRNPDRIIESEMLDLRTNYFAAADIDAKLYTGMSISNIDTSLFNYNFSN